MTGLSMRLNGSLNRLGPEWDGLFEAGAGLQTSREWFAASAEAALPAGAEPQFVTLADNDGPLLLLAMLRINRREWQSLTTPYTCLWQPLVRPGISENLALEAFRMVGQHCGRYAITRLEAIDPSWPALPALVAGLRAAGLACRHYDHFANWFATIAAGWDAYLDDRPGALRETIRRKTRATARNGDVRIEIAATPIEIARLLPAYETVYAASWKEPEPFQRFNHTVATYLAPTGGLRMFVMWNADRPVAAQYWTVAGHGATVLKLAHDEREKRLSPGTVLTATAIRHLIEVEGIRELDFGRGDDPYKRSWVGERRQRLGVLGLQVASWHGFGTMARHDIGRFLRSFRYVTGELRNQRRVN